MKLSKTFSEYKIKNQLTVYFDGIGISIFTSISYYFEQMRIDFNCQGFDSGEHGKQNDLHCVENYSGEWYNTDLL